MVMAASMQTVGAGGDRDRVSKALSRINDAWLHGRPQELAPLLQDSIVMILPGFSGRVEGKTAVVAGFEDFCRDARIHRFEEKDRQVDVLGPVAVATFSFDMTYELAGQKYHSTGRDLWVFAKHQEMWTALWRTMLDVTDEPVEGD
jgi:ketosteroid isomerase-like protein